MVDTRSFGNRPAFATSPEPGLGEGLPFPREGLSFPLYNAELRKYGLEEGEEIDPEAWRELWTELLPARALARSLHLLERRDYTAGLLREKLLEGGYPEVLAEQVLEQLAGWRYLDDVRYAMAYIRSKRAQWGRRRIEQALRGKYLSKSDVEAAFARIELEEGAQEEADPIERWIQKKAYDRVSADARERRRMADFLLRRGFSADMVWERL